MAAGLMISPQNGNVIHSVAIGHGIPASFSQAGPPSLYKSIIYVATVLQLNWKMHPYPLVYVRHCCSGGPLERGPCVPGYLLLFVCVDERLMKGPLNLTRIDSTKHIVWIW